jgi:hypothetical protein
VATVLAAAAVFAAVPADAQAVDATKPASGTIMICNHSGYLFNVYADGPSIREDDLSGREHECANWKSVLIGSYQIGFGVRIPTNQRVIVGARFKRRGQVLYKSFNNEGVITASIGKGDLLRADLLITQK